MFAADTHGLSGADYEANYSLIEVINYRKILDITIIECTAFSANDKLEEYFKCGMKQSNYRYYKKLHYYYY